MTKEEITAFNNSLKVEFGLKEKRVCAKFGLMWGGGARVQSFARPIRPDGDICLYVRQLRLVRDACDRKGYYKVSEDDSWMRTQLTNWQSMRYSFLLKEVGYGKYAITWRGRKYLERVDAAKDLIDREKEYDN